jgi:uncharacterized protein
VKSISVTKTPLVPSNSTIYERLKAHFSGDRLGIYKRVGLWGYGVVVALVLVAMIYLLVTAAPTVEVRSQADVPFSEASEDSSRTIMPPEISQIDDRQTQATLVSSKNSLTMPISDIDTSLPLRSSEPAWRSNAAKWHKGRRNHIAIVIDDLGLDQDVSKKLALFEGPLTLSFLPYAENLPQQTAMLRQNGHELLVHLPMEPKDMAADPGPNALLSSIDFAEFERRIRWNLGRFEGFVGINNHMGSALTENAGLMVRVMVQLRKDGYLFLDSMTSPNSVGTRAAEATGVPHLERDVFLDNDRNIKAILAQLDRTEKIAQQRGYAIAIGHPYRETLKALQFWTAKLDKETFDLVPLSQLIAAIDAKEKLAAAQQQ